MGNNLDKLSPFNKKGLPFQDKPFTFISKII